MAPTSGLELTRLIRDDTALKETPVILITGKSDSAGAVDGFCRRRRRCRRQAIPFRSAGGAHRPADRPCESGQGIAPRQCRARCAGGYPGDRAGRNPRRVREERGGTVAAQQAGRAATLAVGSETPRSSAQVVAVQRDRQIGEHKPRLVAAIVTDRIDLQRVERLAADQLRHPVGQLDLAARTALAPAQICPSLRAGGCSGRPRRAVTAPPQARAFRPVRALRSPRPWSRPA